MHEGGGRCVGSNKVVELKKKKKKKKECREKSASSTESPYHTGTPGSWQPGAAR